MSVEVQLFAGLTSLGTIDANVIDASMGVIGGMLKPTTAYYSAYQTFFRAHLEKADWKALELLGLKATSVLTGQLMAVGGIIITDLKGLDEIEVNVCGIGWQEMAQLFPDS
ncbi:hypothetical protein [Hymenobacter persicinus]|uniref:Uncharacterized protein n=1 Tax=Hymenobacter persicinus TaxID=2025506 RepID=A0A4Q5LEW8_9BACT|nr:hypothetical protein [Hymenobacter persicinus]RYU83239.1 hypothetical protein EWM57_02835 [Hymenobacter persicinus]